MAKTTGIKIVTFGSAGRFQHDVYEFGVNARTRQFYEVSQEIVDMQKKVNEALWNLTPDYSGPVTSVLEYELPSRKHREEIENNSKEISEPREPLSGRTIDVTCGMR